MCVCVSLSLSPKRHATCTFHVSMWNHIRVCGGGGVKRDIGRVLEVVHSWVNENVTRWRASQGAVDLFSARCCTLIIKSTSPTLIFESTSLQGEVDLFSASCCTHICVVFFGFVLRMRVGGIATSVGQSKCHKVVFLVESWVFGVLGSAPKKTNLNFFWCKNQPRGFLVINFFGADLNRIVPVTEM